MHYLPNVKSTCLYTTYIINDMYKNGRRLCIIILPARFLHVSVKYGDIFLNIGM